MDRTRRNSSPPSKVRNALAQRIKRYFFLGLTMIFLGFGSLSVLGKNGVLDMLELQTLQRSLQNENATLKEEQERLKAEIDRLKDPRYLEFLARERLGLMKPQEAFLILDPPSPNSPIDN